MIGIVTSVFTAVNFTRMLVALWVRRKRARANCISEASTMRLLKLVPDNTNLDFMRWRNIALVLSIIATVASLVAGGSQGPQPRRRLPRRPDDPRRPSPRKWTSSSSATTSTGSTSARRASRKSAVRRSFQIRLPKPGGGEAAANRAASQVRSMLEPANIPAPGSIRSRRCRARSAKSWPRTAAWRSARDARDRDLHLVPVRMAVRRRGARDPCSTTCR